MMFKLINDNGAHLGATIQAIISGHAGQERSATDRNDCPAFVFTVRELSEQWCSSLLILCSAVLLFVHKSL